MSSNKFEELKPCPFCGSKAEVSILSMYEWYAACTSCQAKIALNYSKEEAIEAWNKRASQWVSVDDPPKEDGTYLVFYKSGAYGFDLYQDGRFDQDGRFGTLHVTHWRELNKPEE